MNKTVYNSLVVIGTTLFVVGTVGTVIKRLWRS